MKTFLHNVVVVLNEIFQFLKVKEINFNEFRELDVKYYYKHHGLSREKIAEGNDKVLSSIYGDSQNIVNITTFILFAINSIIFLFFFAFNLEMKESNNLTETILETMLNLGFTDSVRHIIVIIFNLGLLMVISAVRFISNDDFVKISGNALLLIVTYFSMLFSFHSFIEEVKLKEVDNSYYIVDFPFMKERGFKVNYHTKGFAKKARIEFLDAFLLKNGKDLINSSQDFKLNMISDMDLTTIVNDKLLETGLNEYPVLKRGWEQKKEVARNIAVIKEFINNNGYNDYIKSMVHNERRVGYFIGHEGVY